MEAPVKSLDAIIAEFCASLRGLYGARLVGLWLYGSQARGQATEGSDIDVLVVLKEPVCPETELERMIDLVAEFNLRFEVLFSILPVGEERFRTAEGPFWSNVRREGRAA